MNRTLILPVLILIALTACKVQKLSTTSANNIKHETPEIKSVSGIIEPLLTHHASNQGITRKMPLKQTDSSDNVCIDGGLSTGLFEAVDSVLAAISGKNAFAKTGKYFITSVKTGDSYYNWVYGIEDEKGKSILPNVFSNIDEDRAGNAIVSFGDLKALYSADFKQLLPFDYIYISLLPYSKEAYLVRMAGESNDIIINSEGKNYIPNQPYTTYTFYFNDNVKNKQIVGIKNLNNQKCALFDVAAKKFLTGFDYGNIDYITGAFIVSDANGEYCNILNENYKPLLPKNYLRLDVLPDGHFLLRDGNKFELVTKEGKNAFNDYDYIEFLNNGTSAYILKKGNTAIVSDINGTNIYNKVFEDVEANATSYSLDVKQNGKWGIIDLLGTTLLPIKYDTIARLGNYRLAMGRKEPTIYFPAYSDNFMPKTLEYDEISLNGYNYFMVKKNNKVGLINNIFEIVIPTEFDNVVQTDNSTQIIVIRNGRKGIFDLERQTLLIAPQYDNIANFRAGSGNFYLTRIKNKYGLLDAKGTLIAPVEHDYIGTTEKSNKTYIICVKGEKIEREIPLSSGY
ncbi:MAG: WG repeat-containing protein [Niabella sp.]